jgi:putative hemolysin
VQFHHVAGCRRGRVGLHGTVPKKHVVEIAWQTRPRPEFDCPLDRLAEEPVSLPKLLRAYLSIGAKICGPPALDCGFKTIDFLTLVDLRQMAAPARARFLS